MHYRSDGCGGMGQLRKNKLVAIILLAAVIMVLSLYLFSTKKIRIDFSGGKMIASDGKGPYEGGVDGVQTYSTKIINRDVFRYTDGFQEIGLDYLRECPLDERVNGGHTTKISIKSIQHGLLYQHRAIRDGHRRKVHWITTDDIVVVSF